MKQLLTARITRVDAATQTVHGVVAEERTDKTGKLKFDYAASKPHFEAWIAERLEASQGASQGNVREMHQPSAAGLVQDWTFDDAAREVRCVAKVVDPLAWLKCETGVYTGFSIGGDYAGPLWADPVEAGVKRFAAKPYEVSLVDNPQMWGTNFDFMNAAGVHETRQFRGGATTMKAPEFVRGLVADGERRLAQLRGESTDESAKCIRGMWSVSDLASLIEKLSWLCSDARWEAEYEEDGSTIPAALAASLAELGNILVAMATEETAELTAKYLPPLDGSFDSVAMSLGAIAGSPALQRAAGTDKKLTRKLQKIHDGAVECGATCSGKVNMARGGNAPAQEGDMTKDEILGVLTEALLGPQPEEKPVGLLTRAMGGVLAGADFKLALGESLQAVLKPEIERAMTAIGEVKATADGLVTSQAELAARVELLEKTPAGGPLPLTRATGIAPERGGPVVATAQPVVGAPVHNPALARTRIDEVFRRGPGPAAAPQPAA